MPDEGEDLVISVFAIQTPQPNFEKMRSFHQAFVIYSVNG